MYLIPMAWIYVALMMAIAEATNTNGTVLGGLMTFVLYGLVPVGLVVYLMGAPSRKKARKAQEQADLAAYLQAQTEKNAPESATQPDASGHTSADAVAPVREKP